MGAVRALPNCQFDNLSSISRCGIDAVSMRLSGARAPSWKAFFDFWLYRSSVWLDSQPSPPTSRQHHVLAVGQILAHLHLRLSRHGSPASCGSVSHSLQTNIATSHTAPTRTLLPQHHGAALVPQQEHYGSSYRAATSVAIEATRHIVRVGDLRPMMVGQSAAQDAPWSLAPFYPCCP